MLEFVPNSLDVRLVRLAIGSLLVLQVIGCNFGDDHVFCNK